MTSTTAAVPTANAARYVDQLCKHWSHKLEVAQDGGRARIVMLNGAVVTLDARPDALGVAIDGADDAALDAVKPVVTSHLDRFAFREAPLAFDWTDG